MKVIIAFVCVALLSLGFSSGITNHTWQLLSIEDASQKRNLVIQGSPVNLEFFGDKLTVVSCDTVQATCNFVKDYAFQTKLELQDNTKCPLISRQVNWYFRYRFSSLVYVLQNDTLQLRDRSGVNYILVKLN